MTDESLRELKSMTREELLELVALCGYRVALASEIQSVTGLWDKWPDLCVWYRDAEDQFIVRVRLDGYWMDLCISQGEVEIDCGEYEPCEPRAVVRWFLTHGFDVWKGLP